VNVTPITRPREVVRTEDVVEGVTIELTTDEASDLLRFLSSSGFPSMAATRLYNPVGYAVERALLQAGVRE
jgi:hypothetical protein